LHMLRGRMSNQPDSLDDTARPSASLFKFLMLSFGFAAIRFIAGPIRMKVLTSVLTKAQYAGATIIMMTISLVAMISSLGCYEFMIRRLPGRSDEYQRQVLGLVVRFFGGLSVALAVILVAALGMLHFQKLDLSPVNLAACGVALVLTVHLLHRTFFMLGRSEVGRVRIMQFLQADLWFLPVLALWLITHDLSMTAILWLWVGWLILTTAVSWGWVPVARAIAGRADVVSVREILRFGAPLLPMIAGEWLFRLGDKYVLLLFKDMDTVANYTLCMNIAFIVYIAGATVLDTLIPELNRLRNRLSEGSVVALSNDGQLKTVFTLMLRYSFILSAGGGAALALLGPSILRVLSSAKYVDAAGILPWTAAIPFFFLLSYVFTRALLAMDRTRVVGALTAGAAILNVVLNVLLVPKHGGIGAALSTTVSLVALAIASGVVMRCWRWISLREFMPARGAVYLVALAVGFHTLQRFVADGIVVILGGVVWCAIWVFALRLISSADLRRLALKPVKGD
jgi:O-antigen/teichoic acid export membrane protein